MTIWTKSIAFLKRLKPEPYLRNLNPRTNFQLDEKIRLIPHCSCHTRRPRWTVVRWGWGWWRCVDCGAFAWKVRLGSPPAAG